MLKLNTFIALFVFCAGFLGPSSYSAQAQRQRNRPISPDPYIAAASGEAELAIKRFKVAPGLKASLWAAEPQLANPVTFCFDEKGRAYVCETFRLGAGVDDIRGIMNWLDEELASKSVDEREAEMKRHLGSRFAEYSKRSERIRMLEDSTGAGKVDHATVFADGFNTPLDGIGAGILAHDGKVWYANIPNLWMLSDTNHDGAADLRQSLHYGFGVRVGFLGHDLHGPRFGPDGKLYFSVGDRGSAVKVADGRTVGNPETGCVFRCNEDGSELEVFAYGLRNPQDLVFDKYGNLFTGDNNSDSGDQARWVYLVEGSDNGWRVGFQFMERPYSRGPFNAEKLWYPAFPGQAANIVPPIANISSGPSGLAYFPGTGLPARYRDHFFLVDFRGGAANSGVHSFTLDAQGAGFVLTNAEEFIWSMLATDAKFGVDGGLYVSDWVQGWGLTGKGRIYRVHDPELDADRAILETKKLLAEGFAQRSVEELSRLLAHQDMRVRQGAQFALARRGLEGLQVLETVARTSADPLGRLHAIWGIGQVAGQYRQALSQVSRAMNLLVSLLADPDVEVRAQAAKVLGDRQYQPAFNELVRLLKSADPRPRFFSALALGKLGRREALPHIYTLLDENRDKDPYLRHAAVMALAWIGDVPALTSASQDRSPSVRLGALLALRRLQRPEVTRFLRDNEPRLVLEAARAINDEPVNSGMQDLAALIDSPQLKAWMSHAAEGKPNLSSGLSSAELEALLRRVLNANFRFRTPETAQALARFAAQPDASDAMRTEALDELGDWPNPSGRDRVMGLWRPVQGASPSGTPEEALESQFKDILQNASDNVRAALFRAVGALKIASAGPALADEVANTNGMAKARSEALNALAALDSPLLPVAMENARKDESVTLRNAATRLETRLKSSNPVLRLSSTLENGTVSEQQTALAALATVPGSRADEVIGQWLDKMRAGQAPRELQLDILDAAHKRSANLVTAKLEQIESGRAADDPLARYLETLYGGSTNEGKKIFFERPEAQCVRCHKAEGQGGDVGPDLTHIAAQKDPSYLLESIILPNRQIAAGFESVMVELKNGDSYAGVLKSDVPDELVINTPEQGLLTLKKAEIESRRASLSPMPEGLGQVLSKQDLRNLVAYLSSLK